MKNLFYIYVVLLMHSLQFKAQSILIEEVAPLPNEILEASGLELGDEPNTFWSHNDKNNPTEIYQFDSTGLLIKTLIINNGLTVKQSDYEDLAKDDENNLYIGDVGDNKLDKTVYRIYKINKESTDSIELSEVPTIQLFYPGFEIYNCESIIWYDGYIYLFVKDPLTLKGLITKSFRVPDEPGQYEAEFLENFNVPGAYPFPITGADISADGSTLILMSKDEFYLFRCFTIPYFFSASASMLVPFERAYQSTRIPQTEGVVFLDDETIYIVDEQTDIEEGPPFEFGNLYTYNLAELYTNELLSCSDDNFDCGVVKNYSFSNNDIGWTSINKNNINSTSSIIDDKLQTTFFYGGIERANVGIQQSNITLKKSNVYVIQFEAKATPERYIDVLIEDSISNFYLKDSVFVSTDFQLFSLQFLVSDDVAEASLRFDIGGRFTLTSFTLDNVCIDATECRPFEQIDSLLTNVSIKAENYITADSIINNTAPIAYIAADSICLMPNFEVLQDADFSALIGNCED